MIYIYMYIFIFVYLHIYIFMYTHVNKTKGDIHPTKAKESGACWKQLHVDCKRTMFPQQAMWKKNSHEWPGPLQKRTRSVSSIH